MFYYILYINYIFYILHYMLYVIYYISYLYIPLHTIYCILYFIYYVLYVFYSMNYVLYIIYDISCIVSHMWDHGSEPRRQPRGHPGGKPWSSLREHAAPRCMPGFPSVNAFTLGRLSKGSLLYIPKAPSSFMVDT